MTHARTIHAPAVARDRHGLDAFAGGLRGAAFGPGMPSTPRRAGSGTE